MYHYRVIRIIFQLLFVLGVMLFSISVKAQKKWDGEGGDNQWTTAANWLDNIVPVSTDDVLFDNSILTGNYIVQLPIAQLTVNSILILPGIFSSIKIVLPVANVTIPALIISGPVGLTIGRGGVFINSSGGSPGTALVISDSIRILNGGRFIHNAANGHASYVSHLSRAPGTEWGTFEFDVPGGASYTTSLSGRTYGSLEFSATAAGGMKSYLSNGISTALIRGDLNINMGVNYSLDFTGDLLVQGSLVINGNFNLASSANNNSVKFKEQLVCSGTITESSAGFPVIELNGNTRQNISVTGSIHNSVTVKMNNPAGATLQTAVALPYKLELLSGIITSTNAHLLTLQPNCSILADSSTNNSFIDGPLQKLGLSNTAYFLFPIGKGMVQRWVELKNATGNFTVEFYKNSPYSLSAIFGSGIDHVSRIEYWSIDEIGSSSASLELSFDNVNSGGVTDVNSLRVAHLAGGAWVNLGNLGTSGSAGSAGSVISQMHNIFGPFEKYFTLSASDASQNPLPVEWVNFTVQQVKESILIRWQINNDLHTDWFEIENSRDGLSFNTIKRFPAHQTNYSYVLNNSNLLIGNQYFRIRSMDQAGYSSLSKVIPFLSRYGRIYLASLSTVGISGLYSLKIKSEEKALLLLSIINISGQLIKKVPVQVHPGNQAISLPVYGLATGHYQVFGVSSTLRTNSLGFIKY